jgi:GNAT superfamily N-acetyltransferase
MSDVPTRPQISRNLVVRPAVPADSPALAVLASALHQHQGDPVGHFTPEAITRDVFGPNAIVQALIAELDDQPVGYALLLNAYESAHAARGFYVTDFFIADEARARGVGRELMAACATFARNHGGSFLWWVSKAWNVEAQKFYRTISPIEEPIMAHALTFEKFAALAAEGEAHFVA